MNTIFSIARRYLCAGCCTAIFISSLNWPSLAANHTSQTTDDVVRRDNPLLEQQIVMTDDNARRIEVSPQPAPSDQSPPATRSAAEMAFRRFAQADAEMLKTDCAFELEQLKPHPKLLVFNLIISNLYYDGEFMGMLNNLIENYEYTHDPSKQPVWLQEFATIPRLAGKSLLIAGTFFDMWCDRKEEKELLHSGQDIESLDAKMLRLGQDCNMERGTLMGQGLNFGALSEVKLLDDIRDLALLRYISLRKRLAIREKSESVERKLTIANKIEVSLGSDVVRVVAAPLNLGVLGGPASISTLFAGSETGVQGLIAQFAAHLTGKKTAQALKSRYGELPTYDEAWSQFEIDVKSWTKLAAQTNSTIIDADRKRQYFARAYEGLVILEHVNYSLQKRDRAGVNRETQLHLLGATQGVRGLMSTIAGFRPVYANKVNSTELNAAAAIPYVFGTGARAIFYGYGRTAKIIINRKKNKASSEKVRTDLNNVITTVDKASHL